MISQHGSKIIWFTGMSGAGKSFYAEYLDKVLKKNELQTNLIDGDVIRNKYKIKLGFTYNEICDNNRNIADICANEYKNYDVTIVSVISPYDSIRKEIKTVFGSDIYYIYVYADIESLKERDTKGLYKKADNGEIDNLIGYSNKSKYEAPNSPDIELNTSSNIKPDANYKILEHFINHHLI
tara:strand:+ start:327 stop:869 length:543 start_codon:yes stop_codon:yes gene_type:complete